MQVEIMDTTLRDGEQTPGVSFTVDEKLSMAKMLLEEVKVDRVEVGSARVSQGEKEAVRKIVAWGKKKGYLRQIEVLGFVDGQRSVDWLLETGASVLNLLCKGSAHHVKNQLRKSCAQHLKDIDFVVDYALQNGLKVNFYLEDWSNGMSDSPKYVRELVQAFQDRAARFMLADTLGILNPTVAGKYFHEMLSCFPDVHFDFHGHNDYDLVMANVFTAVKSGLQGIHTTVNGLGERAGNAPFASVIGVLKDQIPGLALQVRENKLSKISRIVEAFSEFGCRPISQSSVSMFLRKPVGFTLMVIVRVIYTKMHYYRNGLVVSENMLWVKLRARLVLLKTLPNWGLNLKMKPLKK